jgi:hypothetical protein
MRHTREKSEMFCFSGFPIDSEGDIKWMNNVSSNRKPKLILKLCGSQDGVRSSNPTRDVGVFQSSCCPAVARVFLRVHRGSKKRQRKRI